MRKRKGSMRKRRGTDLIVKANFFLLILLIIAAMAVFIYFTYDPSKRGYSFPYVIFSSSVDFNFQIEETAEALNGEIYVKNKKIASVEDGKAEINPSELTEDEFIFKTNRNGKMYVFIFNTGDNFDNYDKIDYYVSLRDFSYLNEERVDSYAEIEVLHWPQTPIYYKIIDWGGCEPEALDRMENALQIIEQETDNNVLFQENDDVTTGITINCINKEMVIENHLQDVTCKLFSFDYRKVKINPYEDELIDRESQLLINISNVLISNEETIWEICYLDSEVLGFSLREITSPETRPLIVNGVILNASINLFKSQGPGEAEPNWNSCSPFPATEMHHLLHAFGFAHANQVLFSDPPFYENVPDHAWKDNLAPVLNCNKQKSLQNKYSRCLSHIYSDSESGKCNAVNFFIS